MLEIFALAVVVVIGLYFCALGAVALIQPAHANRFLLGFASSPRVHYIELFIRLLAGAALVVYAPHMIAQDAFSLFGWVLILTTVCLFILPWRWHHRFAQQMVPRATRYITLIGLSSLILGVFIFAAVIRGSAT